MYGFCYGVLQTDFYCSKMFKMVELSDNSTLFTQPKQVLTNNINKKTLSSRIYR